MKFVVALSLIFSIIGLGVFGFAMASHSSEGSHGGCIASVQNAGDCPKETAVLAFVDFHISVFKNFSSGLFAVSLLTLLLSVFLVYIAPIALKPEKIFSRFQYFRFAKIFAAKSFEPQLRWLALHENSPTIFS
ncbi:MAG: hypothetical protein HYV77_01830 [Candidatus Wildermuthbacteria bacterium]|nr:hypothetical protein [Candidatus Wildermuthbacteria bacterium]